MNPPLIFPFKTQKKHYIYDTNTNQIISVNKELYKIAKVKNNNENEAIWKKIYKDYSVFSYFTPNKLKPFHSKAYLVKKLSYTHNQLMLKVTEDCNLSCSYCIYGGTYNGRPLHSKNKMTWETAKKSIDYFFSKNIDLKEKEVFIGFYGGEPLLEYELIKNCVLYIQTYYGNFNPIYSLTTNATIFHEKYIDFLVKNNFALTISLDGSEKVHNSHRIFASNKGTYNIVNQNIKKIITKYPEFAKNFIQISVTLVPPVNFEELHQFFSEFPIHKIKTNLVELF